MYFTCFLINLGFFVAILKYRSLCYCCVYR